MSSPRGVDPGYYAWCKREESERAKADERLLVRIKVSFKRGHGTYGSPRGHAMLKENGEGPGRHRGARLMRQEGLVAKPKRRFRGTTDSKHRLPVAPNVLQRGFDKEAPNTAWVSDITYVWTWEDWLHLAVLIDLHSRRVVGRSVADHMRTELVQNALEMAVGRRYPEPGLVQQIDRNSQYASAEYQDALKRHRIVPRSRA